MKIKTRVKAPWFEDREALAVIVKEVVEEIVHATMAHGPITSPHEGFAIMHEEFDELKEHVWMKPKNRNVKKMRAEAVQVAASAIRFGMDVCG